jgi:hypothetical protein
MIVDLTKHPDIRILEKLKSGYYLSDIYNYLRIQKKRCKNGKDWALNQDYFALSVRVL